MFLEHGHHHGAHRDDPLPVLSSVLQRPFEQDGRQATAAELGIDFGVVEDPLIAAVCVIGEADFLAGHGDGVLTVLGRDGDFCAGLVDCHVCSFGFGRDLGTSRVVGMGGAGSRVTEPW